MRDSQARHLNRIKRWITDALQEKFPKGAAEHKTDLHDMPVEWLIEAAAEEITDLVAYFQTLEEQLAKYKQEIINEALQAGYDEVSKTYSPDHIYEKLLEMKG